MSEILKLKVPLILASGSPRRQKLLTQLGFEFEVRPAEIDEDNHSQLHAPEEYSRQLAEMKAEYVAAKLTEPTIVLGADTIVVLDGKILNKPRDEEDAFNILKALSGRTHTVYTGIALVDSGNGRKTSAVQKTDVTFRDLDDDEIKAYIKSGSPMDKAGAYGIQDDFGAVFVSYIAGCYYNIVGLPLELLYCTLRDFISEEKK